MKILIMGVGGLLGMKLYELLSKRHEVCGTYYSNINNDFKHLDITKKEDVDNFIFLLRPDIVIHTAATRGTRNIIDICKKLKCKLVYISSVDDANISGAIISRLSNYLIVKLGTLYGHGKENFVTLTLKKLRDGEIIKADDRIIKYPTLTDDVAYAVEKLLDANRCGIYHYTSQAGITEHVWAKKIANVFGFTDEKITIKDDVDKGLQIIKNQMGCMFKMIYSFRSDRLSSNETMFRIDVGKELAKKDKIKADMVIPIPESGIYSATGYSAESRIPMYFGLIRDYVCGKTLFNPCLINRIKDLQKKLIVIPEIMKGKRIVLIDEAVISGSTIKVVIERLKKVGIKEIHVRIPSPFMYSECKNRVLDCPRKKLFSSKFKEKELAKHLKVDSVKFLDLKSFVDVSKNKNKCYECFK